MSLEEIIILLEEAIDEARWTKVHTVYQLLQHLSLEDRPQKIVLPEVEIKPKKKRGRPKKTKIEENSERTGRINEQTFIMPEVGVEMETDEFAAHHSDLTTKDKKKRPINTIRQKVQFVGSGEEDAPDDRKQLSKLYNSNITRRRPAAKLVKVRCFKCNKEEMVSPKLAAGDHLYKCNDCH